MCQHWGGPSGGLSLYPAQCGDLCITAFVTDKLSHPARKTLALWDPGSSTAASVGQHVYGVYWGSTPAATSSSRPFRTAQTTSSCFVPMPSLFCRWYLVAEAPVDCAILFGSRALGGWDDQSDLDIIVIHQAAGDDAQEPSLVGLAINQLRQLHYPGYLAYESPHHEVMNGLTEY